MKILSLCMIVKNESSNLLRSLAPLIPYIDEAVVVDTGSEDGTPELAARLGARVFAFPWQDDFSQARNFSLDQALGDWIMWLDADSRVPEEDAAQLKPLIQRESAAILWATNVEPGGGRLLQKRIFPRRPDIRFRYRVHEQLCHPPGLDQIVTPVRIYHWGYETREQRRRKAERNLSYLLADLAERPDDFYLHYQLAKHYFFAGQITTSLEFVERVREMAEVPALNPEIARHAEVLAAQCYDRLGNEDRSRQTLTELTTRHPDYGLAWFQLGQQQFRTGELEPAVQSLNNFLQLGIGHYFLDQPEEKLVLTALLIQAQCLRRLRRWHPAALVLKQAQKLYPDHPGVWLESALLARELHDMEAARKALNTCLALRPDLQKARQLLNEVETGYVSVGH